jgi:hypothetical protein
MDLQGLVTRWCNLLEVLDVLLFNQLFASNWWGSLCQIWKVRKLVTFHADLQKMSWRCEVNLWKHKTWK